jgi:hypothetical protein
MRTTITQLKTALPEGAVIEENRHEGGGMISVYAPKGKAWSCIGSAVVVAQYFDEPEWNLTRSVTLRSLINDVNDGIEPATQDTIANLT